MENQVESIQEGHFVKSKKENFFNLFCILFFIANLLCTGLIINITDSFNYEEYRMPVVGTFLIDNKENLLDIHPRKMVYLSKSAYDKLNQTTFTQKIEDGYNYVLSDSEIGKQLNQDNNGKLKNYSVLMGNRLGSYEYQYTKINQYTVDQTKNRKLKQNIKIINIITIIYVLINLVCLLFIKLFNFIYKIEENHKTENGYYFSLTVLILFNILISLLITLF